MPIEIRELVVKTTVHDQVQAEKPVRHEKLNVEAIVEACMERVEAYLRDLDKR